MKLRNKITGEITRVEFLGNWQTDDGTEIGFRDCNTNSVYSYSSLAELNEDWEDYEEPKNYWWLSPVDTDVVHCVEDVKDEMDQYNKEIGNYFETEEEAEKAVEKLKAWQRLKDKGLRFDGYDVAHNSNGDLCGQLFYNAGDYCIEDVGKDLDLLFGGEE